MKVRGLETKHMVFIKIILGSLLMLMGCGTPNSRSSSIHFDEQALIAEADAYLQEQPITITSFPAVRSAGGLHDYYSEGSYWWENPEDPEGPYIRRDGFRNPHNFVAHKNAMANFRDAVKTLVSAYKWTGDERYAQYALLHLQAWFVNEGTRMNPTLLFSQAIKGIVTGRGIGIIDTVKLIEIALSVRTLQESGFLEGPALADIRRWFDQYASWLCTHPYGIDERDNGNNHSVWWAAQVAAYAQVAEREDLLEMCRQQFKRMLPQQMTPEGTFPEELARTRPYGYTIYNLEAWTTLAELASTSKDNLWDYESPNGSLRRAIDFFVPFIADKSKWTLAPDVVDFDRQPRPTDFLYLAAKGYQEKAYMDLWEKSWPEENKRSWYLMLY